VLNEAGLLDQSLKDSLAKMTKFRNVLGSRLRARGPQLVVRIPRENLSDFGRFKDAVLKWL